MRITSAPAGTGTHERRTTVAFLPGERTALLRHLQPNRHIMQHGVLSSAESVAGVRPLAGATGSSYSCRPDQVDAHLELISRSVSLTPKLWTDAYLAAFARAGGLRLVSFDHDFTRFADLDLLLLEVGRRPQSTAYRTAALALAACMEWCYGIGLRAGLCRAARPDGWRR